MLYNVLEHEGTSPRGDEIKKNKRRSKREAASLQKQAEALAEANLAMEEDEEIHFNRPETIPDTNRVSRNNTPDPEDEDR